MARIDSSSDPEEDMMATAHLILQQAIEQGVGEVRIEPHTNEAFVAYKLGTELRTVHTLPPQRYKELAMQFKMMAQMNIAEGGVPQDGRIGIRCKGRTYTLPVRTEPGQDGETISIRILVE